MVKNHYRWDFVGLSTDTKPTPENSEKVTNGSTYYCSDTSKLYVWCDTQWYERKPLGGGGGGGGSYTAGNGIDITNDTISVDTDTIQEKLTAGTNITITDNVISATGGGSVTPVQTTGTSTTDVMSQNATSSMLFADPGTDTKIKIGSNAYATVGSNAVEIGTNSRASETDSIAIGKDSHSRSSNGGIAIGGNAGTYGYNGVAVGTDAAVTTGDGGVAVGFGAASQYKGGVALGAFSVNNAVGEVNVGSSNTAYGYNSTNYRLISGVHDPVNAHDAATKGYVDANAGGDSVYSTKTTSNSSTGGAIYIGNLDSSQQEQADPTTTDNHYRYFHALPYDNPTSTGAPKNGSINILGECRGDGSIVLGLSAYDGQSSYYQVAVGQGAHTTANSGVAMGYSAGASAENSVAIGRSAAVDVSQNQNSVALGAYSKPTRKGEVNIGTNGNNLGYNNTDYRVIGGVHDGQNVHDAATVAQGNTLATSAPTTSTVGVLGQLYTDTTNMHTYQCTAIDTTDPSNPSYTWTQRW